MLSSWTLRYSGVNGASCPTPRSLVGSNLNCPPTVPGLTIAFHWPFQLGYFASWVTCALPLLISSAQANATMSSAIEPRSDMMTLSGQPSGGSQREDASDPTGMAAELMATDGLLAVKREATSGLHRCEGANDPLSEVPLARGDDQATAAK